MKDIIVSLGVTNVEDEGKLVEVIIFKYDMNMIKIMSKT